MLSGPFLRHGIMCARSDIGQVSNQIKSKTKRNAFPYLSKHAPWAFNFYCFKPFFAFLNDFEIFDSSNFLLVTMYLVSRYFVSRYFVTGSVSYIHPAKSESIRAFAKDLRKTGNIAGPLEPIKNGKKLPMTR